MLPNLVLRLAMEQTCSALAFKLQMYGDGGALS